MRFVVLMTPGDFILGAFVCLLMLVGVGIFILEAYQAFRRWVRRKTRGY